MQTLQAVTSLMGPFFELLNASTRWAAAQGVQEAQAARFAAAMFRGLAGDAMEVTSQPNGFQYLVDEQTPVGLMSFRFILVVFASILRCCSSALASKTGWTERNCCEALEAG